MYQNGEYLCQSRKNIVSSGHFSFPEIVQQDKEDVVKLFNDIRRQFDLNDDQIITVYGEIIGLGVQKGVALAELSKKYWIIFGVKLTDSEGEGSWLDGIDTLRCDSERIFNIYEFPTYDFEIDFNFAENSQNALVETCLEVEKCCPVAKQLENIEGIGEGIVIQAFYKEARFNAKIKGNLHSQGSKVKKLAQLDPVVVENIQQFVLHSTTESRVMQAMSEVGQTKQKVLDKSDTGDIIKWVANDIIIEECQVLKENNLEYSQVAGKVANQVRNIYFKELDSQPMV